MDEQEDNKTFPNATSGVAGLFGITPHGDKGPPPTTDETNDEQPHSMFSDKTVAAPSNLPVPESPLDLPTDPSDLELESGPVSALKIEPATADTTTSTKNWEADLPLETTPKKGFIHLLKKFLPYIAIFAIAIGLYFFYFNDFSFTTLFNSSSLKIESLTSSKTNKEYEQLKKDAAADYTVWLATFFIDVNDDSISSMDADVSGNGLSNFEKYLLNLNPKVYSTRGSEGDGQSVLDGINPWTGQKFTDNQKALVEKYINPELISNRITAAAITRGVTKYAQYVNPDSPYYIDPSTLQQLGSDRKSTRLNSSH